MEEVLKSYTSYPQNLRRTIEGLLGCKIQKTKQHTVKLEYSESQAACFPLLEIYRKPKLAKSDVITMLVSENSENIPNVGA